MALYYLRSESMLNVYDIYNRLNLENDGCIRNVPVYCAAKPGE